MDDRTFIHPGYSLGNWEMTLRFSTWQTAPIFSDSLEKLKLKLETAMSSNFPILKFNVSHEKK